jgi:ATP synthase F1 gamma subunit
MRPISELKQDFEVSRSLRDIIDVLKTAAMIQFRSFQLREKLNEDFIKEVESCFGILAAKKVRHPYLFDRKSMPSIIVVLTSDEGFLGEMNTLLVNMSIDRRRSKNDEMVIFGERGARYLEDAGMSFVFFPGITDEVKYDEAEKIRDYLLREYKKKFGRVIIVYPKFVSLTVQRITVWQILPFQEPIDAEGQDPLRQLLIKEASIEPSQDRVVEGIVELWAGFKIMEMLCSAKQSEFAARIMHLEGSTQELNVLKQKLSFEYFRQVHSLRDKVIREISASKIMLGKRS